MQAIDYIMNDYKPLSFENEVGQAIELFEQTAYSHFPIVQNGLYMGAINHYDVDIAPLNSKTLKELGAKIEPFYTSDRANWFDVLQSFANNDTNILPVLNKDLKYLGYYELNDFLNIFKSTPFLHNEGVILIISKHVNDYSFSEITQIVESNNATLYGAFIASIEHDEAQIILKLSLHDINNTLQSFRRYNYKILSELDKDNYLESLQDRSNYLQKYLNI